MTKNKDHTNSLMRLGVLTCVGSLISLGLITLIKPEMLRDQRTDSQNYSIKDEQTEEQAITEGKQYIMNQITNLESITASEVQEAKLTRAINVYNNLLKEERDCFVKKYGYWIQATEPQNREIKTPKPMRPYNPEKIKLMEINNKPLVLRSVD